MNFKATREALKMTVPEVSKLAGWSVGTISDLENHNRGSDRLREKLRQIYELRADPHGEPAALREGTSLENETAIWRRRATQAEKELAQLKAGLRQLLSTNYDRLTDEAERELPAQPEPEPERGAVRLLKKSIAQRHPQ